MDGPRQEQRGGESGDGRVDSVEAIERKNHLAGLSVAFWWSIEARLRPHSDIKSDALKEGTGWTDETRKWDKKGDKVAFFLKAFGKRFNESAALKPNIRVLQIHQFG